MEAAMPTTTVHDATYELLRQLGLTTFFGNPGSTEQPFLKNFPSDFTYVLALQEASVMGMADAYAQVTRRPALVNIHTGAGTGNAMGNIAGAFHNNAPLIVTAGQQARQMLITEPFLTNRDETLLPRPWVKWAYQPARAEDVPAAIMRGYAMALQPPAGPVFISIPLDDWDQPFTGAAEVRTVSQRYAPDPERLREFAGRLAAAKAPALVLGADIDRAGGWQAAAAFAEKLGAPVFEPPLADRVSFAENHPLFRGALPSAIRPLAKRLEPYDLVLVIGAPVFRYYPYIPGDYLPAGTKLLHITSDPAVAGRAPVGDSLLSDTVLALEGLTQLVSPGPRAGVAPAQAAGTGSARATARPPVSTELPLSPAEVFAAVDEVRGEDTVIVNESTSTLAEMIEWLPTVRSGSYFFAGFGGLGYGVPAAVGVALADRAAGRHRTVLGVIGDGSFQYSVQALWTAAQHGLPIVYLALRNGEYAVLKAFAEVEDTPGVPGMDLPGIDIPSLARGFGCRSVEAGTTDEIKRAYLEAVSAERPTVITVETRSQPSAVAATVS
jgi:benzoylformate decarboxylase